MTRRRIFGLSLMVAAKGATMFTVIILVAAGVALFWPTQQGCVGAGCGAGSQYCASGCCLGTTVVDKVIGCSIRTWGCAPSWSQSTFTCGGGCDGAYDQGACSATWVSVPVYQTVTCSRDVCTTFCQWKTREVCVDKRVKVCMGKICWYEWETVCTTELYQVCTTTCVKEYYQCEVFWGYEQQVSACTRVAASAWTNCCGAAPPPTNTPVPPPPPTSTPVPPMATPTKTPTPTSTFTPSPTATPNVAPLVVSLTPQHGSLVLHGPKLGLPAQTLNGTISGGTLPYTVTLTVQRPDNTTASYNLSPAGNFSFTPANAGDTNFGTTMLGTWRAWFTVTDSGARSATSNTVMWVVVWYPVHGVP